MLNCSGGTDSGRSWNILTTGLSPGPGRHNTFRALKNSTCVLLSEHQVQQIRRNPSDSPGCRPANYIRYRTGSGRDFAAQITGHAMRQCRALGLFCASDTFVLWMSLGEQRNSREAPGRSLIEKPATYWLFLLCRTVPFWYYGLYVPYACTTLVCEWRDTFKCWIWLTN